MKPSELAHLFAIEMRLPKDEAQATKEWMEQHIDAATREAWLGAYRLGYHDESFEPEAAYEAWRKEQDSDG